MKQIHTDLKTFRSAKRQLRIERDGYIEQLDDHWEILCSDEARSAMLKNTAVNALRKIGPYRAVDDLIHGKFSSDSISGIGGVLGSFQRNPIKRLVFSAGGALLGKLFGGDDNEAKGPLGNVISRITAIIQKFRGNVNEDEDELVSPMEMTHNS